MVGEVYGEGFFGVNSVVSEDEVYGMRQVDQVWKIDGYSINYWYVILVVKYIEYGCFFYDLYIVLKSECYVFCYCIVGDGCQNGFFQMYFYWIEW